VVLVPAVVLEAADTAVVLVAKALLQLHIQFLQIIMHQNLQ
jgi:hypothetical protein